jgi:hypothetical protein
VAKLEFDAVVESARGGGALVRLPKDTAAVFETKGRFAVRATFNGVEYRGSTMPMGDGAFGLGITKAIRAEAHAGVGETVHVVVERDTKERTVEIPAELVVALEKAKLTTRFDAMAYTHRKEYAQWIAEAKKSETRHRRVAKAIEMITAGDRLS